MTAREMSKYLRNYLTAKGLTLSIAKSTIGLPNPQRKAHFSLWYQGFCHPLKKLLKKQRFALKKNVQEVARGSIRPRRSLTLPPRLLEHASRRLRRQHHLRWEKTATQYATSGFSETEADSETLSVVMQTP